MLLVGFSVNLILSTLGHPCNATRRYVSGSSLSISNRYPSLCFTRSVVQFTRVSLHTGVWYNAAINVDLQVWTREIVVLLHCTVMEFNRAGS